MEPSKDSDPLVASPPSSAMVYMPFQTPRPKTFDRYKHRQSIGLGIAQIIISILCVIFNSVCIGVTKTGARGNEIALVGHGYWCGILFLITGIFGVVAGRMKTRCQIVSFMVMCIISAVFTIALLVIGILGAIGTDTGYCNDNYHDYYYGYYYNSSYYPVYRSMCYHVPHAKVIIAMESLLAIAGFIEVIAAIWGAALTCGSGVCCCSSNPTMGIMPSGGYFPHNGQMICISQTKGGIYFYAPLETFAHPQGMVPPPAYVQPGWTNSGPDFGQAPPTYVANQGQPLWMIQPATSNPGPLDAQSTTA